MTELKGSETSTATTESSLEELNASWQTFWACGHPRTSSDPVLKPRPSSHTNSGSYMQISYTCCTGVWPFSYTCCPRPHMWQDNHPRLIPERARNSNAASRWKEDPVSIQDISVVISEWPALLSRQSAAGLDQMGLFRVWSWFSLMEIITPGCLKCMDHCGG